MQPQIAMSREFLEAYSRLPKPTQKKVREFTEKFQRDPTASSLNFERVLEARDPKVRSVRIDQAYRAIVIHPPRGDVYLCVWVDHHDDAYRWVKDKCFEVNPHSGNFQLFDMQALSETPAALAATTAEEARPRGLFAEIDDEDLLLAGAPQPLLPAIRAVRSEADLDRLAGYLPAEVSDVLYLFAAGYTLTDAIEESERSRRATQEPIDTEDFKKALETPESQQVFRIVTNEDELERILDAPLEQWRIFLHPSQRRLVEMKAKGPVRVLGSAGTGKTVVLMHRAKHLASHVFTNADDRLLVTTYTRNLALDLHANLKNLCGENLRVADSAERVWHRRARALAAFETQLQDHGGNPEPRDRRPGGTSDR